MNMSQVLEELDRWHDLIRVESSDAAVADRYKGFIAEEVLEALEAKSLGNLVKELCDIIVVTRPIELLGSRYAAKVALHQAHAARALLHELNVYWWSALHIVNQSNFSKMILETELKDAHDHFKQLGIEVCINPIAQNYFGAYSAKDQTVNGKTYACGKLLKGPNYQEINESTEWWK
jgi:hypothetical protein